MKTSQSSQSVAITPISNPCNDIPDHVSINGEICFLLPEIKLNDLKRICGVLQFVSYSLLNPQTIEINQEDLQATVEIALMSLQDISKTIHSFKF